MSSTTTTFLGCKGAALRFLQILLIVAPAFICYGFGQNSVGNLLTVDSWTETFPRIDTSHVKGAQKSNNTTVQGAVVALFTAGGMLGALSCSYIGDKLGRRSTIFLGAVLLTLGQILEASAFGLPQLIVGRLLLGLGAGVLSATVPVWQSECALPQSRGRQVVLVGLFISFGYVLASWVCLGFFQIKNSSVAWRVPLAIPNILSITILCTIYFLPESPRWLVRRGCVEEARQALSALRDRPGDSAEVNAEIGRIESVLETTQTNISWKSIRSGGDKIAYRLMLCLLIQFWQELSGSTLVAIYGTIIFQQNLQLDSQLSRILSGAAVTWKFLSGFVAFATVDRFGRRRLFMVSGTGIGLCMMALAISTSYPRDNHAASVASVFFLFLFNFFVPLGFLGVNYLYCSEVSPIRFRTPMVSISTANHWMWAYVITMVTPVALDTIGYKYYIIFCVVCATIPPTVYFLFPETMGQNLEDIERIFQEADSPRQTVALARELKYSKHGIDILSKTGGAITETVEYVEDPEKQ
ncbi:general substrate transporter [Trichoderma chlorosporum]